MGIRPGRGCPDVRGESDPTPAPETLATRLLMMLVSDPDEAVRGMVWSALVYYSRQPLLGQRLDFALELTRASASPLELLGQLFGKLRHQTEEPEKRPLMRVLHPAAALQSVRPALARGK